MAKLLASIDASEQSPANQFCPTAKIKYYDSIINISTSNIDLFTNTYYKANALLENGNEQAAVETLEALLQKMQVYNSSMTIDMQKLLALSYLRLGERTNCLHNHSAASCIFPIANSGVHVNKTGSYKAIELYQNILRNDPADLESLWLLNIAYMTVGGYPNSVPPQFLLKGLDAKDSVSVKPFMDIAANTGLSINNMGGGSVIDDFNNDGYLDLITSGWGLQEGMHYFINNSDGTFRDASDSSGLSEIKGGLNIMQTDYNNDGLKDVFVLRGAWKSGFGKEPPSLLRNNGDGTFTDVTKESGLLSIHPTQTATWADFNNDGWLDVFIGHESWDDSDPQYCELYLNDHDGTFTNYTKEAGLNVSKFVKGVTSGDYDNDGDADIFISTLNGDKFLFQNDGVKSGKLHFKDVSNSAGFGNEKAKTFATWFFDYDNDGWLDLIVCGYNFTSSLATYAAEEALGKPEANSGEVFLYRNNRDGSFTNITKSMGLTKMVFAMSANFGDIDNDGYPDMFFGTGNPKYQSLVPNKMFKNMGGKYFADVTNSARVGSLQKGHGISFADMDNDGDEDIYIDMGGAYPGDVYQNSFFINPGQNNNNWIEIATRGTTCNRAAIGARLMVYFKENDQPRVVYKDVNSGGSFGANPLRQHIGIGTATSIDSIVIKWPGDKALQTFKNISPNRYINIVQGNNAFTITQLKTLDFTAVKFGMLVKECGK
ncbi:CRTAC1 family protein [Chitinophagaceae bacterium 26-R-25]|nr:CRTAC1 family protein [Chitinophagaceae bacterium 26-R-25]